MDRVDLEGDYPNTFDLYAGKEQASITQYMLDPEAMEYTVQYCQNFIWEIVDSTMYIISATTHILPEDTLERSVLFAKQIKPALASAVKIRSINVNNLHGGYNGDPLKCPLCESSLIIDDVFQICPKGHGVLILAADLIKLGKARLQPPTSQKYAGQSHGIVICPYCSQKMTLVDYQARGIIIDSCTQCPFRWLDAHEADKIAHPPVKLPPFATITT